MLGDEVLEHLLYARRRERAMTGPDDIPFIAKQTRIVLKNCGKFDAESLGRIHGERRFSALSQGTCLR